MNLYDFSTIIHDSNIKEEDKIIAFNQFYEYYSELVRIVLKTKTFTERQLSKDIFRQTWNEGQSETVFKKQLFSSFKTLERIKIGIETNVINKFKIGEDKLSINNLTDFLCIFSFDIYELVRYAEENYNGKKLNFDMGGRNDSSVREIFENANIILHIKHFGASSIHYRDFFSYTVFTIRLMIEVAGKRILGFNSITDDKGNRIREIRTQIAWHFIKQDQLCNKRIKLPIEIETILEIEKWTNQFIHTGNVQPIFLVENALSFLDKLALYKSTEISNYNSVKSDFEKFVKDKIKRTEIININWNEESRVDSKIVSF